MVNSVDPDQTVCSGSTLFASILNLSVMLGNYLQQTTSADIFRCIFFLALLRVSTGHVVQSVKCLTADTCLTADPGVASSIQAQSHSFMEIDHEIISTAFLPPSAD